MSGGDKLRGSTVADSTATSSNVAVTYSRSNSPNNTTTFSTHREAWEKAIADSLTNNRKVGFTLTSDWVASDNADNSNTSFGATMPTEATGAYFYGMLCVPTGADIVLDLKTFKLDRNLINNVKVKAAAGVERGGVIWVQGGTLTVNGTITEYNDSNAKRDVSVVGADVATDATKEAVTGLVVKGGMITGGYTRGAQNGANGGIMVSGQGHLIFNGGAVYNTRVNLTSGTCNGGGISVVGEGSQVDFNGGKVVGNRGGGASFDGAGILANAQTILNVTGGEIAWNTNTNNAGGSLGGGIHLETGVDCSIENAVIHDNAAGQGGGIGAWGTVVVNVKNCEIYNNIGWTQGGGIGVNNSTVSVDSVKIHDNESPRGGAIDILGSIPLQMKGLMVVENNFTRPAWNATDTSSFTKVKSNVLLNQYPITITGPLLNGSKVCVFQNPISETFTSGYVEHNPSDPASRYFISDVTGYDITITPGVEGALLPLTDPTLLWNSAVNSSLNDKGSTVNAVIDNTVVSSWTSDTSGNFAPSDLNSFGSGSEEGALGRSNMRLPAGAHVILDLSEITVTRRLTNAADDGFVFLVEGNLALSNGTVSGGNNRGDGGAFYVKSGGTLSLTNVNITGNNALNGSAIYLEEGATLT
ncbi:MAG: hypothetical protein K2N50_02260, partial [Clostridia bacterium]|nr:hypothetical protein [Clostridia bacterium]